MRFINLALATLFLSSFSIACGANSSLAQQQESPGTADTATDEQQSDTEEVATEPDPQDGFDWRNDPLSPGDWHYSPAENGRAARAVYRQDVNSGKAGAEEFGIACAKDGHLTLQHSLAEAAQTADKDAGQKLHIITSYGKEMVTASESGQGDVISVVVPAQSRLLDHMAYSRGRFAIESPLGKMILPAWPEFTRVIEDCRG